MHICKVTIKNYRAIKKLSWSPQKGLNCLIGPGDVGKTTILKAIELALTSSYRPSVDDTDFFQLEPKNPIQIKVSVGGLPNELKKEQKFGLHLAGWDQSEGIINDPEDDTESILTVQFTLDENLDPLWKVVSGPEEKRISWRDRSALGMTRIGTNAQWHLRWSRKSDLSKYTDSSDEADPHLAEALREARNSIDEAEISELDDVAQDVKRNAEELGVEASGEFEPGLRASAMSIRRGAMSLHEGDIPLENAGLGTRRLLAIAIQRLTFPAGAILLLDEIETGLEPHRLRNLIRKLRTGDGVGQLILTTHSPVALQELKASELQAVQNDSGDCEIHTASQNLQNSIRAASEAFLSKSIIVCEGKTEVGFLRALDELWQTQDNPPLAQRGVHPINGQGSEASERALDINSLGYNTSLFRDSDRQDTLDTEDEARIQASDIDVFEWPGETNIESRVCLDLPGKGLQKIVEYAISEYGFESVRDSLLHHLNPNHTSKEFSEEEFDLRALWKLEKDEMEVRDAIAETAIEKGWFKRIDQGKKLGLIVNAFYENIVDDDTELAEMIDSIYNWIHGE